MTSSTGADQPVPLAAVAAGFLAQRDLRSRAGQTVGGYAARCS